MLTTGDLASNFDNKRRQIDLNTGQNESAKNVSGRLPVYQEILTKNLNHGNTNNDENEITNNDLDMNIPNDDYRLRYVYSMQQNRYN